MLLKIFFKIDYKNTFFSFVQINAQFQLSALTDLDDYNKFFLCHWGYLRNVRLSEP